MFRKSGIALGGALLAVAAVSSGAAHAAEAKVRAVSCFPLGSPVAKPYEALIAEINKRGKGIVNVDLIGKDSFQEADITGITTPITKNNYIVKDVEALVSKPGNLNESLLGMSFLRRLRSFDFSGDFVTLRG